jgi:hypothetical protein
MSFAIREFKFEVQRTLNDRARIGIRPQGWSQYHPR